MDIQTKPNEALANKALPEPLRRALGATFAGGLPGCVLVGGTAIAGYYACHRVSDDMDLFTADARAQAFAVSAVKSLTSISATFREEHKTPTYYHALISLDAHHFTADVVLDENLHRIGTFSTTPSGVTVADLETLLKMKIATLVSRCSAKDLYDLVWLTQNYRFPDVGEWLKLGQMIDAGATPEAMLIALTGANLQQSACGFAEKFGVASEKVLNEIVSLKQKLEISLAEHLTNAPIDAAIAPLIRRIKQIRR